MTFHAWGAAARGAMTLGRSAPVPVAPGVRSRPFFAVEVQTYQPGSPTIYADRPHGAHPHGALARTASVLESVGVIRASDTGYRTRAGEAGAASNEVQVYPGILETAFALDRSLTLTPDNDVGSLAVGAIALNNVGGRFDGIANAQNSDSRPATILAGRQLFHPQLQIWEDPSYADLDRYWSGFAQSWQHSETELTIPLRDPTYLLQRPLQSSIFLGNGGLEGGDDLTGRSKPLLRGRAFNITPILVDATNLIYQISDGPGQVMAVSEGGDPTNIVSAGTVANITTSAPGAGQYIVESSHRGLFFRLATKPVYAITCDAKGDFPAFGPVSFVLTIVRYLLTETMGIPESMLDIGAFIGTTTAYPYRAGAWFGTDPATAAEAIGQLLASIGAKLISTRDGRLRPLVLRAPAVGTTPLDTWTTAEIISLAPQALPAALDPPPASWNVGYARNYTVMTSSLDPDVVGTARQTWLANPVRTAGWNGTGVAAAWRSANRPAVVGGQLVNQTDAQAVANGLGALWAPNNQRRRLYTIVVPVEIGQLRDIGDAIVLSYPLDDLRGGRLGIIVGEQFRSQDMTVTFTVMI